MKFTRAFCGAGTRKHGSYVNVCRNIISNDVIDSWTILHRFGDFARFLLLTPPLFHPNFWGVPVAPDRPCWGQCEQ